MTSFAAAMGRRESPVVRSVRRMVFAVACLYSLLFCWSIVRRVRQVMRIEVRAASLVLAPGSTVGYDVITSGEVDNQIRLEIVQGTRSEVLLEQRGAINHVRSLDPRVFRYAPTVVITPAHLGRFQAGPATLRVTGFGGKKLLHIPAPRVRELQVRLQP